MSYVLHCSTGLGARPMSHSSRLLGRAAPVLLLAPLLSACDMIVLNPAGDVAQQQGNLVVISTILMLLIIVPVMLLTVFFAWKYREANREARYEPEWSHSTQLELAIWGAPLLIIICLGALTWVGTHLLDPYRPLARTAPGQPVPADTRPLEVQVVALDWKWLFIYPEYGIATVNELAAPVDRPIRFRISSSSVMNSFYVPALAGQIYAMPAMETKLHAVFNRPGDYRGFSANYSGAGFSGMRFDARGMTAADFDQWVGQVRGDARTLDRTAYLELAKPSENVVKTHFGQVERGLFDAVVNLCVEPGKMCQHDMMAIDAKGGLGLGGVYNVAQLSYDKFGQRGGAAPARMMVAAMCDTRPVPSDEFELPTPVDLAPLIGAGLALRPGAVTAARSPIPSRF